MYVCVCVCVYDYVHILSNITKPKFVRIIQRSAFDGFALLQWYKWTKPDNIIMAAIGCEKVLTLFDRGMSGRTRKIGQLIYEAAITHFFPNNCNKDIPRCIMVIAVGNGHGYTSSNLGRYGFYFI